MPSLKEYNVKLNRMRGTRKMTKTMKMVSAGKLRKAIARHKASEAYLMAVRDACAGLMGDGSVPEAHPLMTPHREALKAAVFVVSSDRGLCGGFNVELERVLAKWAFDGGARLPKMSVFVWGRRGFAYLKRRFFTNVDFAGNSSVLAYADAVKTAGLAINGFSAGDYDEVYLAVTRSRGAGSNVPTIERVLPLDAGELTTKREGLKSLYICEPDRPAILDMLLPQLVASKFYEAFLSSVSCEHAARMIAMDNATRNADEMINRIMLNRNRARQSAITRELIEIVSSAEALK